MADSVTASPNADECAAAATSARAAEQARLRKERREAKIKAGAAARLNRITGLGGGIQREPPPAPTETASSQPPSGETPKPPPSQPSLHEDPEEVDISQHYYAPRSSDRIHQGEPQRSPMRTNPLGDPANMSETQLRQMMLGFDADNNLASGGGGPAGGQEDPMVKLLRQMMAAGPGAGGDADPFGGASPFQQPLSAAAQPDKYASLWRLLHTAVALGLGLYISLWTSFAGTRAERDGLDESRKRDAETLPDPRTFFWVFATAETILLTTRFFLDRARGVTAAGTGGIWGALASILPQPLKGRVEVALRYGQMFSTIRSDVLVCVFVLGVCAWLRGA
ncbi:hypothetical protein VTK73DRAFT_4794 [Phialemonium thermophilum]|uniref:Uncharacterized protein n=1 Tax=Phialemonium thermophilum TaxID=223376 RepID=A0ABR3XYM3_9PEZI